MLCVRELCLLTAWWISNNLISKKHLRENDLIGYNYIISYIWVNVPLCTDLVYLYISQVHGWTPCSSSQSADKSLLFHPLPLAFRTHSHCLPAMTTPICEMRAQKTEDFFPKWTRCTMYPFQSLRAMGQWLWHLQTMAHSALTCLDSSIRSKISCKKMRQGNWFYYSNLPKLP